MALTQGIHHLGLTVSHLEESADFFIRFLGWSLVRRDPDYPAIFIKDEQVMLTLWAAQTSVPQPFNRKTNIGLHHLALRVESEEKLWELWKLFQAQGVPIEFAPEPLRGGPAKHMMLYDPSGIRIELIYVPN